MTRGGPEAATAPHDIEWLRRYVEFLQLTDHGKLLVVIAIMSNRGGPHFTPELIQDQVYLLNDRVKKVFPFHYTFRHSYQGGVLYSGELAEHLRLLEDDDLIVNSSIILASNKGGLEARDLLRGGMDADGLWTYLRSEASVVLALPENELRQLVFNN